MKKQVLISFILSCIVASPVLAYKTATHQVISAGAATLSGNYQRFLSEFGVEKNSANGLISFGSVAEDNATFLLRRYLYHFYDPINGMGLFGLDPAPVWGYKYTIPFNEFSWTEARNALYDELTSGTPEIRAEKLGKVFRSLGQVIHLVEDMAQPSHTRNDPHVSHSENATAASIFNPSHLEDWAQSNSGYVTAFANSAAQSKSVVSFDDPFETLSLFSNQNFFSDDTIFKNYSQPSYGETNYEDSFLKFGMLGEPAAVVAEDGQIYYVPYIYKTQGAPGGYKLAQVGYFGNQLADNPAVRELAFQIDDEVARENAQILIPQAVSYSAGLLDYFFRGRLSTPKTVTVTDDRVGIKFNVFNETPNEEAGPGKLWALATYRPYDGSDEISQLSDPVDAPSLPRPGQGGLPVKFAFKIPIPYTFKDLKITVTFRGKLGAEDDAVMGYVFSPKPHYVFIIQEGVTLGSPPGEQGFICTYPHCEGGGDNFIFYDEEFRDRKWSNRSQVLTGRFVTHGEIKRIDLSYKTMGTTLSGEGKLFINGQEMTKGYWEAGDTPETPASWRAEMAPELITDNYLLTVRMEDESTFILVPVSYKKLYQEVYKEWGVPYCGICSSSPFVSTRSYAEMDVDLGYWLTPDLSISDTDQWDLVQLSGYGPNTGISESRQEEISNATVYAFNFWRTSLSMGIGSYTQESFFSCDPCTGYIYDENGETVISYEEDLYIKMPVPDLMPLSITGQYQRVYTQAELDVLSALEIEPEYYDLVLN